uniref:Cyclin N-terminal domain-containing protein n=1 Tax=Octactis speculum TaxID=3111310 RepID=A0A7S2CT32_9STRA
MNFFREMEANVRKNISNGMVCSSDINHTHTSPSASAEEPSIANLEESIASLEITRPKLDLSKDQPRIVRTISSIDDMYIERTKRQSSSERLIASSDSSSFDDQMLAEQHHHPISKPPEIPKEQTEDESTEPDEPQFQRLQRRNSTSTIFVDSTMMVPDIDASIKIVCSIIRAHIDEYGSRKPVPIPDSSTRRIAETFIDKGACTVPSAEEINAYFKNIYTNAQMEMECIIMTLIYVERVSKVSKGYLVIRPENWKSLLLACMVMASKVWDDLSMWNADFSQVCHKVNLARINELELALLDFFKYEVTVMASEYAKYYFHLRSSCSRLGLQNVKDKLKPLDLQHAKKLQALSEEYEEVSQMKAAMFRRTQSLPNQYELDSSVSLMGLVGGSELEPIHEPTHGVQASLEQVVHMEQVDAGRCTPHRPHH